MRRVHKARDPIRIGSWRYSTDDFRTLGYSFRCEEGAYDIYLRQTGYWPGIYSLVHVRIDDGAWIEYQKYRMLSAESPNAHAILASRGSSETLKGLAREVELAPRGDWCMVMRAELAGGEHTVWTHQPMEQGYCPLFLYDLVELRPAETTATDWRWGVSEGYRSGLEKNRRIRADLKTPGEVTRYQENVRAYFDRTIGPMPERTELASKTTGAIQRAGFVIEKLWYQTQPGFYVTANLYLPEEIPEPLPAVVYLPGHSPNGKAFEPYQILCQCLAQKGYAVLNIDPVGQGERGPYYAPGNNHECQGIQGFLPRDLNPKYFIWDGVRAIDYLESRPEIDNARIAVTGISGGGVQSFLLASYDPRVTGAVAMGSVVQMESLLWSSYDPDGTFDDGIKEYGCTTADLIACIAPRGFVIQNGGHDAGFPTASGLRVYQDVKHVWEVFGAADRLACESPDAGHEINRAMRRNVYRWLNRWLENDAAGIEDPPVDVLEDKTLQVTSTGLVDTSFSDSESVWSLRSRIVERQVRSLERRREEAASSRTDAEQYTAEVRSDVGSLLKIGSEAQDFNAIVVGANRVGEPAERVYFDTEPPMRISADLWMPPGDGASSVEARVPALVYLNQQSSSPTPKWRAAVLQEGWAVFAVHARLNLAERGTSAVYAGRYPLAMKAADLLRAADFLRARGIVDPAELVYAGVDGHAGIAAMFAALLDDQARGAAVVSVLASFKDVLFKKTCSAPHYHDVALLPGATEVFDIADLAAALAPRHLFLMGARRADLCWVARLYELLEAGGRCVPGPDLEEIPSTLMARWLEQMRD